MFCQCIHPTPPKKTQLNWIFICRCRAHLQDIPVFLARVFFIPFFLVHPRVFTNAGFCHRKWWAERKRRELLWNMAIFGIYDGFLGCINLHLPRWEGFRFPSTWICRLETSSTFAVRYQRSSKRSGNVANLQVGLEWLGRKSISKLNDQCPQPIGSMYGIYVEVLEDLGAFFKYMFYFHPDFLGKIKTQVLTCADFCSIRVVSQPPTGRDAAPREEKFYKSQLILLLDTSTRQLDVSHELTKYMLLGHFFRRFCLKKVCHWVMFEIEGPCAWWIVIYEWEE